MKLKVKSLSVEAERRTLLSDANKFERTKIIVPSDSDVNSSENPSIQKVDQGQVDDVVIDYQFLKIKRDGEGNYAFTKKKYGPLAATDPDRIKKNQKGARFKISPILRNPLSIEQEEKRAIKEKVDHQVESVREKVEKEAAEKGYKEGLKKGHDEAYQKFQEEGAKRFSEIEKIFNSCENAKSEIFRENEKFLMEMINQICKMIILKELNTDSDYILRLSREILEKIGVRENVRIQLNPKDVENISMLNDGLKEKIGGFKNLQIEITDLVELGGCRIETEWNAIDASIKTQLEKIEGAILSRKKKPDEDKSDSGQAKAVDSALSAETKTEDAAQTEVISNENKNSESDE